MNSGIERSPCLAGFFAPIWGCSRRTCLAKMAAMSGSDQNPVVRQAMQFVLRDGAEVSRFLQDNFSEVARRVDGQPDRLERENILLRLASAEEILLALQKAEPERFAAFQTKHGHAGLEGTSDDDKQLRAYDPTDPARHVDRKHQFDFVCGFAARRRHEVLLLPGCDGEAHRFFLERIDMAAPTSPPRTVLPVRWPRAEKLSEARHPTTYTEMMTSLARVLGGRRPEELPGLLGHRLRSHSLIILHPIVDRALDESTLHSYYTEWLPELVAPQRGPHKVHLVQPIAWSPCGLLTRLWRKDKRATPSQAQELIKRLKRAQKEPLAIEDLHELTRIAASDITAFLKQIGWPKTGTAAEKDAERQSFAREVMSDRATSEVMLRRIRQKLKDDE